MNNNYKSIIDHVIKKWGSIILMLFIMGCSSSPIPDKHYYVLSSYQYAQSTGKTMSTNEPRISIGRVKLPYYLNQQGIVRLQNNGQIVLSSNQKWGEKLSYSVPLLLSKAMSLQLSQPVEVHPLPPGIKVKQVVDVTISNFVANHDELFLSATYRITQNNQLQSFQFNETVKLKNEMIKSVIDAYAQGVYSLASAIIRQLN